MQKESQIESSNQTNRCVVVIPLYRPWLKEFELLSIQRTQATLNEYKIVTIMPESMRSTRLPYLSEAAQRVCFSDRFFDGVAGYNKLLLDSTFYRTFADYEFILISQLDSMILEKSLDSFLHLPFDYFGAPFMFNIIQSNKELLGYLNIWQKMLFFTGLWKHSPLVGNGGLSLRRTKSFIKVIDDQDSYKTILQPRNYRLNEDNFWSFHAANLSPGFRVAPFPIALKFAFEVNPRECLRRNQGQLPFGCHAFDRHEPEFWRNTFRDIGIIQ